MNSAEFSLRAAVPADLEAVFALDRAAFSQPWARESFENAFADGHRSVVVVAETSVKGETQLAGFGVAWSVFEEGEIATLAVEEPFRGRGLGALLVADLLARLAARGAAVVFLEVRPSNAAARRLYEKFGFIEAGRRRRYYADNEDALVLKLEL